MEQIKKEYGTWMRAEPRLRYHIVGAKWLRHGGKNPTNRD